MPDRCRAYQLALVLGALDTAAVDPEPCDDPAEHVVVLNRDGVGVDAEVCTAHQQLVAATAPGYIRSIRKHARAA